MLRDLLVRIPQGDDIASVTLTVAPGNVVFVQGPSGSGKSLLLRTVAGFEPICTGGRAGTVTFAGCTQKQWGIPAWRTRVSYVSQSRPTITGTPRELFAAAAELAAQRPRARSPGLAFGDDAHLVDVVARLGLDPAVVLDQQWASLSGGEAHRALLAVHVAARPAVLLLDEPTAACDAVSAAAVEAVLRGCGAALLWVSHDPEQPGRMGGDVFQFPGPSPSGAEERQGQ